MNQEIEIKLFDCGGPDWEKNEYSDIKKALLTSATQFLKSNVNTIKSIINIISSQISAKNNHFDNEPIFFISGQSVASFLASAIDPRFPQIYNDLDIFVPDFVIPSESSADESEDIEARYMINNSKIDIQRVDFVDENIKYEFVNPINATHIWIEPQIIWYRNIYKSITAKEIQNRFQKMAFSVIDDFDINSVKIGILLDKNLENINLIIHPEFLKCLYEGVNIKSCNFNPSTYIRVFGKNISILNIDTVVKRLIESETNETDFVLKIIEKLEYELSILRTANHIYMKFAESENVGNIYDNVTHLMRVNIDMQKKFFRRLEGVAQSLDTFENIYPVYKPVVKQLKKLLCKFQDAFYLRKNYLIMKGSEELQCKFFKSMHSSKWGSLFSFDTQDVAQIISGEQQIKYTSKYEEFLNFIKDVDNIHEDLTILFIRWFDELIEKYGIEKIKDVYAFLQRHDSYKQILKYYYTKKAFFEFIENFNSEKIKKAVVEKYLFFLDEENITEELVERYIKKGRVFLRNVINDNLSLLTEKFDPLELISYDTINLWYAKIDDNVYRINSYTLTEEICNICADVFKIDNSSIEEITKYLESEYMLTFDDVPVSFNFALFDKESNTMLLQFTNQNNNRLYYVVDFINKNVEKDLRKIVSYPRLNRAFKKILFETAPA